MTDSSSALPAEKFLSKFFEKLTENDFASDRVLAAFYLGYKKQLETLSDTKNATSAIPTIFQYYTEYIIRNKDLNTTEKKEEIGKLFVSIKNSIFDTQTDTEAADDVNPRLGRTSDVTPTANSAANSAAHSSATLANTPTTTNTMKVKTTVHTTKPIITQSSGNIKVKLNKKHALGVLSEYIKQSFIITYEEPDVEFTQDDEDFHNAATAVITEEIIKDIGQLPQATKDVEFNNKNQLIEIWKKCENKCIKFILDDKLANVLRKTYYIDSTVVDLSKPVLRTAGNKDPDAPEELKKELNDVLPQETLNSKYRATEYPGKITVVQSEVLTEVMIRAKQNASVVMVADENQFIPGSAADQGYRSRVMALYYSSSYNLCLQNIAIVYPFVHGHLLYSPNVLVFQDHTQPSYPMLGAADGRKISVITSAPKYRPATNIPNQDKYQLDIRLYLPKTRYADSSKVKEQLDGIFRTALFFGFDTIVVGDRGIIDSWAPAYHTAELLAECIARYKNKFKEIVVAVPEKPLFEIFKKCIAH